VYCSRKPNEPWQYLYHAAHLQSPPSLWYTCALPPNAQCSVKCPPRWPDLKPHVWNPLTLSESNVFPNDLHTAAFTKQRDLTIRLAWEVSFRFVSFRSFRSPSVFYLPVHSRCRGCLFSLDHTEPHTTVGRAPLDEGSARRRDLYLTTQTLTTDKHPCPRRDSNPRSQHALGRRPTP
jgi:hypothetical protein